MKRGEATSLLAYSNHTCDERMSADLVIFSNLTPEENAWCATHRHGKIFRQMMFTKISSERPQIAIQSRCAEARRELEEKMAKKTKAIVFGDRLNQILFQDWIDYRHPGLFCPGVLALSPFC